MTRLGRLAAAVLIMAGCSGENQAVPDDTLVVGVWELPRTYDPQRARLASEVQVAPLLLPGLLAYDSAGQVVPQLAESWDLSPDGLTYIFRLRPSTWSDGEVLDAQDVVASFRRIFDPASHLVDASGEFAAIMNGADVLARRVPAKTLGVRALTDDVVEFRLAYPDPSFLQQLAAPRAGIVPVHAMRKQGKAVFRPGKMTVSGSYSINASDPTRLVLDCRAPAETVCHFRTIRLDLVRDAASGLADFAAGKLSLLEISDMPGRMIEAMERPLREKMMVEPGWSSAMLLFNAKTGPVADRRVREALALLTDQQALVETAYPELGVLPLQSLLPPLMPSYGAPAQPAWASWSAAQKAEEAGRRLIEAGYAAGRPLELVLLSTRSDGDQRVVQALQDQWSSHNIRLHVQLLDDESALEAAIRKGDFHLARATVSVHDDQPEAILERFGCRARRRLNMTLCNSEADALVAEARQLNDVTKRAGMFKRAEQILQDEVPVLPLYVPARRTMVSARLRNWVNNAAGIHPLATLEPLR